jgi:hypothetical protein
MSINKADESFISTFCLVPTILQTTPTVTLKNSTAGWIHGWTMSSSVEHLLAPRWGIIYLYFLSWSSIADLHEATSAHLQLDQDPPVNCKRAINVYTWASLARLRAVNCRGSESLPVPPLCTLIPSLVQQAKSILVWHKKMHFLNIKLGNPVYQAGLDLTPTWAGLLRNWHSGVQVNLVYYTMGKQATR